MNERMDGLWQDVAMGVGAVLASVHVGQFVLIEYEADGEWDPSPYAQCAPEGGSWYLEVVSQNYLPAVRWPIDELALRRAGWMLPDDETANWWRTAETSENAAEIMLSALRLGRLCTDPSALRWSVGTFPSGPDGGLPVPSDQASLILLAA